jgi:hypothetical protein
VTGSNAIYLKCSTPGNIFCAYFEEFLNEDMFLRLVLRLTTCAVSAKQVLYKYYEWWVSRELEGSGSYIFHSTIPERLRKSRKNPNQCTWYAAEYRIGYLSNISLDRHRYTIVRTVLEDICDKPIRIQSYCAVARLHGVWEKETDDLLREIQWINCARCRVAPTVQHRPPVIG